MGDHSGAMTDYAVAADLYETKLRDGDLVIAFVRPRPPAFLADSPTVTTRPSLICNYNLDGRTIRQRLQYRNQIDMQFSSARGRSRRSTGSDYGRPNSRLCKKLHEGYVTSQSFRE